MVIRRTVIISLKSVKSTCATMLATGAPSLEIPFRFAKSTHISVPKTLATYATIWVTGKMIKGYESGCHWKNESR